MRAWTRTLAFSAAALLAPAAALAQQAFTAKTVNLRAGPDRGYPVVVVLAPNTPVDVRGCVDGYRWCDVAIGADEGWVYAGNLVSPYEQRRVPLLGYGAAIGLPLLAFSFGSYWDQHYRNRPFYRDRARWANRPQYGGGPPRPGFGRPDARPPGRPDFRPPGRPNDGRPNIGRPNDGGRPNIGRPEGRPPQGARPTMNRPPEGNRPASGGRPQGGGGGGRPHGGGGGGGGRPGGGHGGNGPGGR